MFSPSVQVFVDELVYKMCWMLSEMRYSTMTNAGARADRLPGPSSGSKAWNLCRPLHLLTSLLQECTPHPHTVTERDSPPAGGELGGLS